MAGGFDALPVAASGQTRFHGQVHERRRQRRSARINKFGVLLARGAAAKVGDAPIGDAQPSRLIAAARRVDDARVGEEDGPAHAAPSGRASKRSSTAMRMATPAST